VSRTSPGGPPRTIRVARGEPREWKPMNIPKRLIECLTKNNVRYEILHHTEAFSAQRIAEAEHVKAEYHAKVVMVRSGEQHFMVVVPANRRVDLEKVEQITGHTVWLDTEPEFKSFFPDCQVGTMPPFGNLYDLPMFVDSSLTHEDYIVFEAGTYTEAIKLSYADYEQIVNPQIADLTVKVHHMQRV
jgi:Ala-tRNA(Pro) deacylase